MKASGYNHYNSPLVQTNCTKESMPLVCPPLDLSLDPSTLLSFSSYGEHAVWVTKDYKAYAIGSNRGSRISTYLANEVFMEPVEVILPDSKGFPMQILSAACGFFYTLYMCCTIQEDGNQGTPILILFWASENKNIIINLLLSILAIINQLEFLLEVVGQRLLMKKALFTVQLHIIQMNMIEILHINSFSLSYRLMRKQFLLRVVITILWLYLIEEKFLQMAQ